MLKICILMALTLLVASASAAAEMQRVRISDDGQAFMLSESGRPFVPWGFNYDHDSDGRLLEEYWDQQWSAVESDFREMKQLGANVVRIHLQFGALMQSPTAPRESALVHLGRLLKLAEQMELYIDLTGLGCYHKPDVPAWYDALSEQQRWETQAVFWEAVAKTCTDSPAVFCYNLMNEPVVPGGDASREDWLGPGFGGKHFTQFIALQRADRDRAEIARRWIRTLVAAIRKHDKQRLVTVGLVPWSLDRPGLTSGFDPLKIAEELDFIAVHLYPEQGKVADAIETLKGFAAANKPVVIEEIFPLKCDAAELGRFIDQSRPYAAGWIGFYWGTTPQQLRSGEQTIAASITLSWLELFQNKRKAASRFQDVSCAGFYPHHLQGICLDEDAIYWSFTTTLVKTNLDGKAIERVPVANHHGDLCFHDGKLYVAVNLGKFNDPNGNADSWVYVYDAQTLKEVARHETPEVFHGAGGIGVRDGRFFVVGGLPDGVEENYVYEYDDGFRFLKRHTLHSGHTKLGIQTATFAGDRWWFGCYGDPEVLLVTDGDFTMQGRYTVDCSLGIVGLPDRRLLCANGRCKEPAGCFGAAHAITIQEILTSTSPAADTAAER